MTIQRCTTCHLWMLPFGDSGMVHVCYNCGLCLPDPDLKEEEEDEVQEVQKENRQDR